MDEVDESGINSGIARRLGITGALERVGKTLRRGRHHGIDQMTSPKRVRRALEDMGPTVVKLGQILSTRVDLFAPQRIAEFERLPDRASAGPFDAIRRQLATALAQLFKAAISLEGLGRMLDPGFDMFSEARPFLVRIGRKRAGENGRKKLARGRRTGREPAWRTTPGC